MMIRRALILVLLGALSVPALALDYVTDVMPIFEQKCFECHSLRDGKSKGSLEFDNLADMADIFIGPFTTMKPGNAEESLLVELVTDESSPDTMPPGGKGDRMTREEIEVLRNWLDSGAAVHPSPGSGEMKLTEEEWTSSSGKVITATFRSLDGDIVELLMKGKSYRLPLAKLSEASQKRARELGK